MEEGSAHALCSSIAPEASEGFERRGAKQPKKLPRPPGADRESDGPESPSTRSRRRAVKHGAVGGRMTARWSGVFRERAATPSSKRISKRNAGGFSHGARRAVSEEDVFAAGARERYVGCRSGFEVTRRCVQGKPRGLTRSTSSSDRKARGPDGAALHSLRARLQWLVDAERRKRALGGHVLRIVGRAIEPRLPVPRRLIESVEGAWGLDSGGR